MERSKEDIRKTIKALEQQVDIMLSEAQKKFKYKLEHDKAVFEKSAIERHKIIKQAVHRTIFDARIRNLVAAPFIYAVIFPFILLDGFVSLYQAICFRLWDIPRVARKDYIIIDRHRLPYLNVLQKLNCVYCGYANGLVGYVAEVSSRTEQYWCPIKHALRVKQPHLHYYDFIDYGDYENLLARIRELRKQLE